jgi:hypothetical protein
VCTSSLVSISSSRFHSFSFMFIHFHISSLFHYHFHFHFQCTPRSDIKTMKQWLDPACSLRKLSELNLESIPWVLFKNELSTSILSLLTADIVSWHGGKEGSIQVPCIPWRNDDRAI